MRYILNRAIVQPIDWIIHSTTCMYWFNNVTFLAFLLLLFFYIYCIGYLLIILRTPYLDNDNLFFSSSRVRIKMLNTLYYNILYITILFYLYIIYVFITNIIRKKYVIIFLLFNLILVSVLYC